MNVLSRSLLGAILASALAIPAGSAFAQADEPADLRFTAADVRFMQHMIVHHAQALEMSAHVDERTDSSDIRTLARRIELSQQDEIAFMEQWLRDRGFSVPEVRPTLGQEHAGNHVEHHHQHADHHHHHAEMPGMVTAEQMAALAVARGAYFDRLFLKLMIHHHEGALVMVEELFSAEGAGQEPSIFQFASHVEADQRAEIARMRAMLSNTPHR